MNNPFDVIDARLSNIETLLLDLKHSPAKSSLKDVPQFFGVDICEQVTGAAKSTIYRNTSKNLMPHYRRDGKLLFKRDEIYAWMTECKVETVGEFSQKMDDKLTTRRGR